jgi:kynurenine 3-monooxygenase
VKIYFQHKLTGADFNKNTAWFERRDKGAKTDHAQNPTQNETEETKRATEFSVKFDLMIGADGAHSATRYHLMKYARMSYQQEYIDTLWCEFRIDPKKTYGSVTAFAMPPNHLHIWPGGSLMFIAIPSSDKSFTCTLFAPAAHFESLSARPETDLEPFFARHFPGVCPELITPADLQKQFTENPHLPLISIKCTPYHHRSSVVILGDAAHAMVPFYGQGMNAGMEDVRVLFDILDANGVFSPSLSGTDACEVARERALDEYTKVRTPDAHTINDFALHNYEEMRSGVTSPLYKLRKYVEEKISVYLPSSGFRTQYTRISFSNERYSEVQNSVQRQSRILVGAMVLTFLAFGGLQGTSLYKNPGLRSMTQQLHRLWR